MEAVLIPYTIPETLVPTSMFSFWLGTASYSIQFLAKCSRRYPPNSINSTKQAGLGHRECSSLWEYLSPTCSRYLLATCTFTPLYGRLCNVLGRKRANHTALLFATVGVLMCGLSTSMEMLILARFVCLIFASMFFFLLYYSIVFWNRWRWFDDNFIVSSSLSTSPRLLLTHYCFSSIVISDMYSMRVRIVCSLMLTKSNFQDCL